MDKMPITRLKLHGKYGVGKYALVDGDYDGEYFSQFHWYVNAGGYVVRTDGEGGYFYLHREVSKPPDGLWVDHADRDKLNNRSCNLRWCTISQSAANRGIKQTKHGYKGIFKMGNKYYTHFDGKTVAGSGSTSKEVAAKKYDDMARNKFGDFATLNFE